MTYLGGGGAGLLLGPSLQGQDACDVLLAPRRGGWGSTQRCDLLLPSLLGQAVLGQAVGGGPWAALFSHPPHPPALSMEL